MSILKIIIIYFFSIVFIFANDNIILTNEEKKFIKSNPVIKIGGGESFEPFIFKNSKGDILGIDRDIANLIEKKTGLKINFELGVWSEIQKRAKKRELDGLSSTIISKERKAYYNFSQVYLNYNAIVIINKLNKSHIKSKKDVQNKKVSVQKSNMAFINLANSLGNVEIVYYDTIYEVLNAVVKNEVDFTILDESIFYLAEKLAIGDFIQTSFTLGKKYDLVFSLNKEKPLLESIFNKALASINKRQIEDIKNKWFGTLDSKIEFTKEEKEYLYTKNRINFCIDPDWYPFQKNKNGKHIGMSADLLKLFEKELGLPFSLVSTKNWSESIDFVKNKKCDLLPLAMKTKQRGDYFNFTDSYVESPIVISTLIDEPFIEDIRTLKNKKIATTKGYVFTDIIKEKFKNIDIVEVNSINEGLAFVKDKDVYAYIGSLPSVSYKINNNYVGELKVSSILDKPLQLSIAINKEDLLLTSIFNKLIKEIDKNEVSSIVNKWTSIKLEKHFDYKLMYKIIGIFLFIIILVLFWGIKHKKDKERIDSLYKKLDIEKRRIDLLNMQLIKKELKLEDANRKLKVLSSMDKLTGIYNRRTIDEYLEKEIKRSNRTKEVFSLIMIDIDYFKKVNDIFGHQVGDEVLKAVAKTINQNIRRSDILGRWGGEEFLIVCPSTNMDGVKILAEKIRKKIEEYRFKIVSNKTISLGVTISKETDDSSTILKRCDDALYKAKKNGRNKVEYL